ncbi:extracellular solute-binding protein [Magnetovibrio sp.]|uniref:extracellular solute-binding protein n=1 Tax=Magnetovibrio sp. TaxID=2024836 RepID=UPI002F921E50
MPSLKSAFCATAAVLSVVFSMPSTWAADIAPIHAIAMHGAPKYGPDFKHFDYVNPNAPKGGSIRYGGLGSFDSFNGFISKGEVADGIGSLYDSLLTSSADEAFTEYGLLAESVEVPEDRSWIVFHMRPEAKWHDGQPITAEDVKWTFETLIEKGAPSYRFYYADVDKVDVIDPLSVKFTFKTKENRELPLIIGQMAVLPKHYWATRDFEKTSLEPPLGSGPYKLTAFDVGRSVTYTRVEDYWGRNLPVNVGHNNFNEIRYEYFRDASVSVEAFKGGAIDFRSENTSKIWATSYDMPEVANGLIVKEEVGHERPQGMQGFVPNTRRAIFKDARVRQALSYAFDFEWANKNLFYGQYTRSRSFFDNSELAATGLPSADELKILEPYRGLIPDEVFTTEFHPPATQGDGRIRDNLRQADRLLKEAGWEIKDKQRVNTATGEVMEFEVLLIQPEFERVVLPFAKNLERLGVKARVRTIDTAQYIERIRSFDFDIVVSSWGQSMSPGNEQRGFWGTAAADTPGSRNLIGIKDPVIDALIDGIISAGTREDLVTRVHALDRVLQWGHYVVPHWHIPYDRLIYWNKFTRPDIVPMQGTQIGTWWYDEAKAAKLAAAQGKK